MRIVLAGMLSVAISCGSSAEAADLAAGKERAELCAGCHGEGGVSQTQNIPSLAAQPDQLDRKSVV